MSTQQTVIDPSVCAHCAQGGGLHLADCPAELAAQDQDDQVEPAPAEVPELQVEHGLAAEEFAALTDFAEDLGARMTAVPIVRRGEIALARLLELRALRPAPRRPTVGEVELAPRKQDGSGQLAQPQRCGKRIDITGVRCISQAGHGGECR